MVLYASEILILYFGSEFVINNNYNIDVGILTAFMLYTSQISDITIALGFAMGRFFQSIGASGKIFK